MAMTGRIALPSFQVWASGLAAATNLVFFDDSWSHEDQQIAVSLNPLCGAEELADNRQIAKKRNSRHRRIVVLIRQSAKHDGLAIFDAGHNVNGLKRGVGQLGAIRTASSSDERLDLRVQVHRDRVVIVDTR